LSNSILSSSIPELAKLLRDKKISSVDLCKLYLERIKKHKELNAYISVFEKEALQAGAAIDKEGFTSADPLLKGIPISLKDIFLVKDTKTTCASKMLEQYIAPYDATVTKRLKDKKAILLGKTNMDEFAMGSSNEHSYFGPVKNPWDNTRVSGGSSGGSAAAVSAGLSQISFGTDTGGSVRLPASYTGIVALKPTYGRISRYGVVAFASSLDQPGPMARNVHDLAVAYDAVAGLDPKDSTTSSIKSGSVYDYIVKEVDTNKKDLAKKTIGVPSEFIKEGVTKDVMKVFEGTLSSFKELGFNIVDIELPHAKYALDVYYIINPGEASSNLSRYDGIRFGHRSKDFKDLSSLYSDSRGEGFGEEVKRRIMLGTFVLSAGYYDAYFAKAAKVRALIRNDFEKAYEKCDAILMPVSPFTAFKLGEKMSDPLSMYLSDIFTISINLAAVPSLAFPAGFSPSGLPIGMQLIGKHFDEKTLFGITRLLEMKEKDNFNRVSVE
jgi:aspartyl-tRNA(Asn)/glutamyl-tRNA(Gln) amidotransferase subunit A